MNNYGGCNEKTDNELLRDAFLRWQCRVRQIAMRENGGYPDEAITPMLKLSDNTEPSARLITVLSKSPIHSKISEMRHMVKSTHDPAQRREKAIEFFAGTYYQKVREFSDILTATFSPGTTRAQDIHAASSCTLVFDSYGQRFDLSCIVSALARGSPFFQATWWHNMLFNPRLHPSTVILGFQPDWANSSAKPKITDNNSRGRN